MAVSGCDGQQDSLPPGWRVARFGDMISIRGGLSYKGEMISVAGNALVTMGCVSSSRRFNVAGLKRYSGEYAEAHTLRVGDMVIATRDVTQNRELLGSPAVIPKGLPGGAVIAATNLYKLSNRSDSPSEFLYWVMRAPAYRNHIIASAKGTTVLMLTKDAVENFTFPLPPLPEQRAIAHILGTLDDKIELNRRMNETLEAMARALFKSWFVDFDPVHAKAESRLGGTGLPKPLADLFPDSFEDSELGEIPKGWQVKALNDVLSELETGGRPKGGVSGYATGTPSVGAESIVGLGVFDYSKTKYVPDEFFMKMTKGRIKSRDVLLYKDGGRPGEFEPHVTLFGDGFPFDTCAINEHVYRMRVKQEIGQNYFLFWLSSDDVMEEMRIKGTGVAIPGLNSTQVKSLTMLVPTIRVAKAFDALVDLWITRILANCKESRTLSALRDTLLPKLISGALRVPFQSDVSAKDPEHEKDQRT
jgi:type I restriction enzyme S subunit